MIKDPITALVDFAKDIKPYHTKIIEILVDYVYEETMNVKVNDAMEMDVKSEADFHLNFCPEGYGVPPWGDYYKRNLDNTIDGTIITSDSFIFNIVNVYSPDFVVVAGNQVLHFPENSIFSITNSFGNDGKWKVISSFYDSINAQTRIQCEFFSNQLLLKMFATFSSSWFQEGFIWIDSTNNDHKPRVYVGGMWVPFSILYSEPNDPMFIISTTAPIGVPPGSYWYNNTGNGTLRLYDGSSWNVVNTRNYYVGSSPDDLRANRNIMYVTGKVSNYFGVGQTIEITNSTHNHNGKWLITKMCDDVYFTELTVQHVTSTIADGAIYTSISADPTPHWPTGLYWYNGGTGLLKMWDGGSWISPLYPYTVSSNSPSAPNINDLWYNTNLNILSEYTGSAWVEVDSDYVVIGPTPVPDAQGPRYNDDGFVITNPVPSFDIIKVQSLSQPSILNNEYVVFGAVDGCVVASGIPDPLTPSAIFHIAGEKLSNFSVGQTFIVQGSTGNDGIWKISDIKYDILTNATLLTSIFVSVSTVDDTTTGRPHELFQTWDSVFGLGLGGIDLDLPLTSANILTYAISNYDFPEMCPYRSPTTAFTKIKEKIETNVSLPYAPITAKIVSVSATTSSSPGNFIVKSQDSESSGNYEHFFVPGSVFLIQESENNDGMWTVYSSTFDAANNQTIIIPVEVIPRTPSGDGSVSTIVEPYGVISAEMASFKDFIGVSIFESNIPTPWEFFYYAAPTATIYDISTNNNVNTIIVEGDVQRFFPIGSKLTIQQSKKTSNEYPFVETVNEGAWIWTVSGLTYDNNKTKIQVLESLTEPDLQKGYVSGQPSWVRGIGWDQAGWSNEGNSWIGIADRHMLAGTDFNLITNYDLFVSRQGSFDQTYFDRGGFDDILQQILPL